MVPNSTFVTETSTDDFAETSKPPSFTNQRKKDKRHEGKGIEYVICPTVFS